MKVISALGEVKKPFPKTVLAIGVFDGLHKGHRELITKTVQRAQRRNGTSMVMTFHPHPVHVLHPEIYLPLIASFSHRLKLLEDLGVDICFPVHFTKRFSMLTPEKFIKHYLMEALQPVEIFVGDDFRFGHDRVGTLGYFQSVGKHCGFKVNIIESVKKGEKAISSTRIRQLIASGNLREAKKFLGRHVSLMGKVRHGDGRGRYLGFPTANIYPDNEVIPPVGVYAVKVALGKKNFYGMANVGRVPSFKKFNTRINVEVHLFDFKQSIYGQSMIVEFIEKIRDEKPFATQEDFIAQLNSDEQKTRQILRRYR